jgi:sulfite dehydrogenase
MADGGVFVLHIPLAPYRCPPGPYERVCQVADYFKRAKPKSKIIVLDSNPDILSKAGLFRGAWNNLYKGMIDYRPNSEIADVDVKGMTVKLQFDNVKGDVINVVPPQRAGDIAHQSGLVTANNRWCGVDWLTTESVAVKGVHVLGDATLSAAGMPKSASMANQQAKVCAAAVIELLKDQPVNPAPMLMNACYSFVDAKSAIHVTSIHQYSATDKSFVAIKAATGVSSAVSELEGNYAWGWAKNIWADTLT